MMSRKNSEIVIYTIGHSNREQEEFTGLLQKNKIRVLVDIRRLPGSAKYPHFNQDELSMSLDSLGILYVHLKELGGRRRQSNTSRNTIWKNKSFQAYADYMATDEFRKGIDILLEHATKQRTAIMCSEAVWWRCHRALVADYLKSNGIEVYHIVNAAAPKLHPYTSAARIRGGKLYYYE
jgi:uncharacterized protein (DUF488 family)